MVSIASASAFAITFAHCPAPASDPKLLKPLAGAHLGIVYPIAFCDCTTGRQAGMCGASKIHAEGRPPKLHMLPATRALH